MSDYFFTSSTFFRASGEGFIFRAFPISTKAYFLYRDKMRVRGC
jgi:hypothetical protein